MSSVTPPSSSSPSISRHLSSSSLCLPPVSISFSSPSDPPIYPLSQSDLLCQCAKSVCASVDALRHSLRKKASNQGRLEPFSAAVGGAQTLSAPHPHALTIIHTDTRKHNMPGEIIYGRGDESQTETHLVSNLIRDMWLTLARRSTRKSMIPNRAGVCRLKKKKKKQDWALEKD